MYKKIVVASDSFKGSLTSLQVAQNVERAVCEVYPSCDVVKVNVADGGEGTMDALQQTLGGRKVTLSVSDPLGRPVHASYVILEDGITAVLEMSAASGLPLLTPEERDPSKTSTLGTGELICDALAQYPVKEDDVFFLPAGRIHAIGAGCFLAEIQQTSDVTYRIYDFKRKDKDGNYRQLHTEEAAEAIDYTVYNDYRTQYTPCKNQAVKVVECPYFTTSVYDIDSPTPIEAVANDTFVILIVLKGEGTVTTDGGETVSVKAGDTLLIAAENSRLEVDGNIKLIETHID